MAATSFLYHTQGLRGYRHLRTEYRGGAVYHHVELDPHTRSCRLCGARWHALVLNGTFERTFRALPVGKSRQFIVLHGHEQARGACGACAREPIDFADGKRRCLKAFGRYVIDLCAISPIKHVANSLGVGWDFVKDLFKGALKQRLARRKWKDVRYIAVDEFATHKGHRYMTVVLNLETGEILHRHEGKDAEALLPFLWKLKRRGVSLQAVAMDMSPAYAAAVRTVFRTLDIVHDPYHVVALANTALDDTRRDMCRELTGEERTLLKGTRFLLLKGLENLKAPGWRRQDGCALDDQSLVLARFVEVPVRIEVTAGSEGPELQDRLRADQVPASAGQLHAVSDQVPARFDDSGGDGIACRDVAVVVQVRRVLQQVVGAFVDRRVCRSRSRRRSPPAASRPPPCWPCPGECSARASRPSTLTRQ